MGTSSRKLRLTCSIIGLLFAIIVFLGFRHFKCVVIAMRCGPHVGNLLNTLESEDHTIEGSGELCDAIPGLIGPALPGIRVTAEVGHIFGSESCISITAFIPHSFLRLV